MANIFKCEICGRFISYNSLDRGEIEIRHSYTWNGIDPTTYEDMDYYAHKECVEKEREKLKRYKEKYDRDRKTD